MVVVAVDQLLTLTPGAPQRAPPPRCLVDIADCLTPGSSVPRELRFGDARRLVLPEQRDVSDIATLVTKCFYDDTQVHATIPSFALAELRRKVPPALANASPAVQERWRTACNGLLSRSSARLRIPSLRASIDDTLMLALEEQRPGCEPELICCCELSLRPMDGRLPGELAAPRQMQIGFAPPAPPAYGAYLANLGVRPSHRRRGLARKMLAACEWIVQESWELRELYLHVDLHNAAAATLYHVRLARPHPALLMRARRGDALAAHRRLLSLPPLAGPGLRAAAQL